MESTTLSSKTSCGAPPESDVDLSLFVGDLASNVTDAVLLTAFSTVGPIR
jgi:hypothetical protein